ncbi:MAG: DsbA family oxidoreductase [Novosphingobium sp.]
MNAPTPVTIEIFSDVMCPWCVIGYKQLEQALGTLEGEIEAEIRWQPFELNPHMPPEGEDAASHIARKYGRAPDPAMRGQMEAMAAQAGYDMRYLGEGEEPESRLWNTFLAHKLLRWALEQHGAEAQTRLKLALFDAHFQQRRNLGNREVLLDVAQGAGLDREGAIAALEDAALEEQVRQAEELAMEMDITAVPTMLINRKYMIPGAQNPDTYVNLLRRVVERGG